MFVIPNALEIRPFCEPKGYFFIYHGVKIGRRYYISKLISYFCFVVYDFFIRVYTGGSGIRGSRLLVRLIFIRMKLESVYKLVCEEEDYRGIHRAPDSSDSPLYDVTLTGVYPDDIYTSDNALRYYGAGYSYDALALSIIHVYHHKPDKRIRIYRAIPIGITTVEKIARYEKDMEYIMKYGKIPSDVKNWEYSSEYYDFMVDEIEKLSKLPQDEKIEINDRDWVGITPEYTKDHGETQYGEGKYRVLTKVVPCKHVYTEGNSLQEWGYDTGD